MCKFHQCNRICIGADCRDWLTQWQKTYSIHQSSSFTKRKIKQFNCHYPCDSMQVTCIFYSKNWFGASDNTTWILWQEQFENKWGSSCWLVCSIYMLNKPLSSVQLQVKFLAKKTLLQLLAVNLNVTQGNLWEAVKLTTLMHIGNHTEKNLVN